MKVGDLMTRDVVTVTPQHSLKEVARVLTTRRISGVPVCDEEAVDAGVVTLSGELDNRSEAELVGGYARQVPGVVDIRSQLTWRFDDLARRVSRQRLPARVL